MIAGPNGSGKTSLTRWLQKNDVYLGQYINPHDIAQNLEGSYEARTTGAQQAADTLREEYIKSKLSFIGVENPQTNVERVALRAAQGGHDVPLDRIEPRWRRSMGLAAEAILRSDEAFVFDNSDTEFSGAVPRLVLRWKHDRIKNERYWGETPPTPDWVTKYISNRLRDEFRRQ